MFICLSAIQPYGVDRAGNEAKMALELCKRGMGVRVSLVVVMEGWGGDGGYVLKHTTRGSGGVRDGMRNMSLSRFGIW